MPLSPGRIARASNTRVTGKSRLACASARARRHLLGLLAMRGSTRVATPLARGSGAAAPRSAPRPPGRETDLRVPGGPSSSASPRTGL